MQEKSSNGLRRLLNYQVKKIKDSEKKLEIFISKIIQEYPNSTILLFGSRARGDSKPYSDYDIAVFLDRLEDSLETCEKLRKLRPKGLSVDIIVLDLKDLEEPVTKAMLKNKKILYDKLKLFEK
ncbi:MAG: nucleotidyltransferase domain-containing protein [Nitrososphaeria archaeon]